MTERQNYILFHHQRTHSNQISSSQRAKSSVNTAILETKVGIQIAAIINLISFLCLAPHLMRTIHTEIKKILLVSFCEIMYSHTRIYFLFIENPSIIIFNMLSLNSSSIFFRKSKWSFALVLIYFLLVSGIQADAQAPAMQNSPAVKKTIPLFETMKSNPWSNIKGFRSAQFGMNEKSVYQAIAKDFKITKSKVVKRVHPSEKTIGLEIVVPKLFSTGGTAKVGYILGHKSKKLGQINIVWGQGAAKNVDGQSVVDMANMLRVHFIKKRYKEETLILNGKLSKNSTIVFRGRDKKDRMIIVMLNTAPVPKEGVNKNSINQIQLSLSYILKPDNPDVLTITDSDF